ncbi:MAG: Peptidase S24-like protein [Candidatus Tokpelaia sp. JSC189]|nr:MAG: Peptidase S24-like protein [Candidatus Tokpelaia sp. JSC189]
MSKNILNRIRNRLDELQLTMTGACEKAGLGRETLRKVFERGNTPTITTLSKLAPVLQTTLEWLLIGNGDGGQTSTVPISNISTANNVEIPITNTMLLDIPILGVAAGNHTHGAFQLEATVINYVRRPPAIATAKNVYGLYVEGDSMQPLHKAADLLILHPGRPARIGDSVVIQFKTSESGYLEAILGILYKRDGKIVEIEKLNPHALIKLETRTIMTVHRVLTINDLFGI